MTTSRQELGLRGEQVAQDWLVARGWRLIERRFRSGHRDIDLVMERVAGDHVMIAFVEVKTRVSGAFGGPLGAVHWRKQREMARAARDWMASRRRSSDYYRFDVVGVICGGGPPEVVHVENAFRVG
ncbi:MAG: YraN family protein [Gemmatimonadaceae bacterium]|nr:YraN family protein [Gemmatimonadaceae bacterium]MDQ3244613.1 YraN family protein [Gemmatimonadota bacterium]